MSYIVEYPGEPVEYLILNNPGEKFWLKFDIDSTEDIELATKFDTIGECSFYNQRINNHRKSGVVKKYKEKDNEKG